jgi:hypothetical protein
MKATHYIKVIFTTDPIYSTYYYGELDSGKQVTLYRIYRYSKLVPMKVGRTVRMIEVHEPSNRSNLEYVCIPPHLRANITVSKPTVTITEK